MVQPELLRTVIAYLQRRGADYAEARHVAVLHESLAVENAQVKHVSRSADEGIGLRVLVGGSWGFACTPQRTAAACRRAADEALAIARASATINRRPVSLAPLAPQRGRYDTPCEVDPFTVPLSNKLDYLFWASQVLQESPHIQRTIALLDFYRTDKHLVTTEGTDVAQRIIESAAMIEAVAHSGGEVQRRSYPNSHHGAFAQSGYEYVKSLDLVGGARQIRQEVAALLRAKEPRPGPTTVILDSSQLALQIHESCGHPAELDRVQGAELSYAGGSFLTTDKRGRFRYGSRLVNLVADSTTPQGAGTFGFDDEGVPAGRHDLVRRGLFVGYLSSRESAAKARLSASSGAMRAESWSVPPLVRMTNVNLEPGDASLDELIHDTKRGYLLSTNKSWSIDDRRLNFQFSTEIGWEIVNGRLGRIVKNPIYTGITPRFWGGCTGIAHRSHWKLWGIPNCGKGEPTQSMHVGHGAAPARFARVLVGRGA